MSAPLRLPTGFRLHAHDRLASTNDEAKRLAGAGEPHGAVVWARVQTKGRGRRGRDWASPAGNLYVSYLLRPTVAATQAPEAGFVAALALAEAAEAILPAAAEIRCKWPNDLLVGGRKAAGILLESALGADGALDWIVVGCGVNRVSHPARTRWPATDLETEGARGTSLDHLLALLTHRLEQGLALWQREGFAAIRERWAARAWALGEEITLATAEGEVRGRHAGLDADGALLLDTPTGRMSFRHGDVGPDAPTQVVLAPGRR